MVLALLGWQGMVLAQGTVKGFVRAEQDGAPVLFAAVVLGGLGTAYGALIGALIVGIVVEASSLWIPADLKFASGLFILIVILLFRPQGILGRRERIG